LVLTLLGCAVLGLAALAVPDGASGWRGWGALGLAGLALGSLGWLARWRWGLVHREADGERLFSASLDLLALLGPDGVVLRCNPASQRILGLPPEALAGQGLMSLAHPDDREVVAGFLAMPSASKPRGIEIRCRFADGSYRWLAWSLTPSAGGERLYAVVHDLTKRREAEAVQGRFEAVLNGLDAALFVADARTDEILFANQAFKAAHGAHCVGRGVRGLAVPQPERGDYRVDPRHLTLADLPKELFDGELQHPRSGLWYHVRELATRWVDGRVVRMGIANEITDRKQMEQVAREQEERLARTSRLITMGEMASTLAHELNQPLAAIANYSMGCVSRLKSGDYRVEDLLAAMEKASAQAERAGKVIRRIRDFVRKSEPNRVPVALAEVMEDALGIAEIETRKAGVRLTVDMAADLPRVFADRIMVEQVLLNLIRNGVEAMGDTPADQRALAVRAWPNPEGMVEIVVADRGHGIGEADLDRLFTPFFTTKAEGMGMGLNICRSIVEFHYGRLWVEPNPAGGTQFHFTLPLETARESSLP
jgi:PAS domain S-box-containing protein